MTFLSTLQRSRRDDYMADIMAGDGQWDNLFARTRAKGKALGVTSEAGIERLSDEYRRRRKR